MHVRISEETTYYEHGYPVGGVLIKQGDDKPIGYALNNHIDFTISYNENESQDGFVIVGFEISPRRYDFWFLSPSFDSIYYGNKDMVQGTCTKERAPSMVIEGEGLQKSETVWISLPTILVIFINSFSE